MAFAHAVSAGDRELEGSSRADLRLLGPADTVFIDTDEPPDGVPDKFQYQRWLEVVATPEGRANTIGFVIGGASAAGSPDKRIAPRTSINTPNFDKPMYFMYTETPITQSLPGAGTPIQPEERGLYYRESNYFSQSLTDGQLNAQGQMSDIPDIGIRVVEMDLLKAEAHFRLGNFAEAITLVNKSREANGELPPIIDVNGPAQTTPEEIRACVPKLYDGSCGGLWEAIQYEKRIETFGSHGLIPWADGRGWGCLVAGTVTELPIPARQLDLMGEPNYTFGGHPGERGSAPAPTDCPLLFNPTAG
jgi:hypothetical protein